MSLESRGPRTGRVEPGGSNLTKRRRSILTSPQNLVLSSILLVAAVLRSVHLGRLSLWYDEVVTLRVARASSWSDLIALLIRIDATDAPLFPAVLRLWIAVFGPSDAAARALAAAFGVATVALVVSIGRALFDRITALVAGTFAAVSPSLVYYSREARMYAALVFLTCLAWRLLLAFRGGDDGARRQGYIACLVALTLVHPLGLLMIVALAIGYVIELKQTRLRPLGWIWTQAVWLAIVAVWLPRYFGRPPETTTGTLPIRFLLGVPLNFFGGDFRSFAILVAVMAGSEGWRRLRDRRLEHTLEASAESGCARTSLLLMAAWICFPIALLYAYSIVRHPIFGPERYNVFVAPAFLCLLARGITRLPRPVAILAVSAVLLLSGIRLGTLVYGHSDRSDWRAAATLFRARGVRRVVLILPATEPFPDAEVATARYYLNPEIVVERRAAGAAIEFEDADAVVIRSDVDGAATNAVHVDGLRIEDPSSFNHRRTLPSGP